MNRRLSLGEMTWPDDDVRLPVEWAEAVTINVLDLTWRGFDEVRRKSLDQVDLVASAPEQLERSLTELHFLEITLLWKQDTDGYSSVQPLHESPELARRTSASAKPPAYDLGFVHIDNRRWKWPIEAKVLPTADAVGEYLKDVREKFIAGVAAPFVGQAGMIGYLLKGLPPKAFSAIGDKLGQPMVPMPEFKARHHCLTRHERSIAPAICLHHMIMELSPSV